MDIQLTDEQVEKMVKQSINAYVMSQMKSKIDAVIKADYHMHQSIAVEIRESIDRIMYEKIEQALTNKQISQFIDSKKISQDVSDAVLQVVSEKIKDAVQEVFY